MHGDRGLLCFKSAEGAIRPQGSLLRSARVGQVGFLGSESVSPAIRLWINESRSYRVLDFDGRQLCAEQAESGAVQQNSPPIQRKSVETH